MSDRLNDAIRRVKKAAKAAATIYGELPSGEGYNSSEYAEPVTVMGILDRVLAEMERQEDLEHDTNTMDARLEIVRTAGPHLLESEEDEGEDGEEESDA